MDNHEPHEKHEVDVPKGELLVYRADDGRIKLDVRLQDETVWLTQPLLARLFQTTQQNVSQHILNIYEEGELTLEATHKKFLSVRQEGNRQVRRTLDFYNLDMIISVGYRVKSLIATRFRIWATERLKEYIVKGFVMDDERLKNPPVKGSAVPDYFDEMLARIRDIRASERRMYLRVREIFTMAADYDPSWSETTKFFSIIQNKLHFAATQWRGNADRHQQSRHCLLGQSPGMDEKDLSGRGRTFCPRVPGSLSGVSCSISRKKDGCTRLFLSVTCAASKVLLHLVQQRHTRAFPGKIYL